jgi:hypothetical protein
MATKGKFGQFLEETPSWAKGLLVVGGLVVVGWGGFTIYTAIKSASSQKKAKQNLSNASDDLQKLVAGGVQPSYLGSQYSDWADSISTALTGCIAFTGYMDTLNGIFGQMNNTADVLQLITAFGIRPIAACWYSEPVDAIMGNTPKSDMAGWFTNQLSKSDRDSINKLLAAKNINYSFQ